MSASQDAAIEPGDSRSKAARDLELVRRIVERTHRRVDPHAFHYVHWGAIVLAWYPLAQWLQNRGELGAVAAVGAVALLTGGVLSVVREWRLRRRRRLPGDDTHLSRQVVRITFASLAAGALLSALAPSTGFIDGPHVPVIWGLVYANMAVMIGIVYERDFLWAGVVIFGSALLAMALPELAGYVLGPCMGLGLVVPGLRAEARTRALAAEERVPLESRGGHAPRA